VDQQEPRLDFVGLPGAVDGHGDDLLRHICIRVCARDGIPRKYIRRRGLRGGGRSSGLGMGR
jgi:hypothetical protein